MLMFASPLFLIHSQTNLTHSQKNEGASIDVEVCPRSFGVKSLNQ